MSIFKPAKLEMAFLKMGLYGGAGSGKTWTSSDVAIGLHKYTKSKKPIYFSDTETGSDFVLDKFKKAKIKLLVGKSRAFKDLVAGVDEAEKNGSILIIDSITHYWNELMDAYQKKHNLSRITLRHWIPLKQTWREFTEKFVNSKLHIIMCGRVGDVWEDVEDEEGVLETKRTGTKMKAEVETAFEPSLLVELVKHRKSSRAGAGWVHRAWVVKDRFDTIDGKNFDDPGFDEFLPHIKKLNIHGEHRALDSDRNSEDMFPDNNNYARGRERDIMIEKIEAEIHLLCPGSAQNSDVKTARLNLMQEVFETKSKKEISGMQNELLIIAYKALKNKRLIKAKAEESKEEEKPKKEKEEIDGQ